MLEFPPAHAHGDLREIFDDVFFVTGAVKMTKPVPSTFSRNMTVVREGESLTLVGSMRLDERGLDALDALGRVEHVIRLAAFHGLDDPFYRDRYGARVWAVRGSLYNRGFDVSTDPAGAYFEPDEWTDADTELPLADAKLHIIETSTLPEGLLLLEREGGILVSGDCLQNWGPDEYFSWPTKVLMKLMGFFEPYNIGPGWLKGAKPDLDGIRAILDLDFEHVLPVHGSEVIGGAREKYRPVIESLT